MSTTIATIVLLLIGTTAMFLLGWLCRAVWYERHTNYEAEVQRREYAKLWAEHHRLLRENQLCEQPANVVNLHRSQR